MSCIPQTVESGCSRRQRLLGAVQQGTVRGQRSSTRRMRKDHVFLLPLSSKWGLVQQVQVSNFIIVQQRRRLLFTPLHPFIKRLGEVRHYHTCNVMSYHISPAAHSHSPHFSHAIYSTSTTIHNRFWNSQSWQHCTCISYSHPAAAAGPSTASGIYASLVRRKSFRAGVLGLDVKSVLVMRGFSDGKVEELR